MITLGERLKLERKRLKFSQTKFGGLGGVKKGAQIAYESGNRNPDSSYFVNLVKIGVDVQFVLTGVKSLNLDMVVKESSPDCEYTEGEFEDKLKRIAQIRGWFSEIEEERGIDFAESKKGIALMELAFKTNMDKRNVQLAYKLFFDADDNN